MRDPTRIERIITKLSNLWKKYPDMRFCQLVENIITTRENFYIEDDKFEKKLEEFDQLMDAYKRLP